MSKSLIYKRSQTPPFIKYFAFYIPVLKLINSYRFISSKEIQALSEEHPRNTLNKLQKLFHNGYISRHKIPAFDFDQQQKQKGVIYTLTRKGADMLINCDCSMFGKVYVPKKETTLFFIKHELEISHFRSCLQLALNSKPKADLAFWSQGGPLQKILERWQIQGAKVIPDGYFMLKNKERELHYFVEIDRSTMSLRRFADKIRRYRRFFNQNRKNKNFPPLFRVLTIAKSPQRAKNLRLLTIKTDPQNKGSSRFWFGHEGLYALENPKMILKPVLQAGHVAEQGKFSLLD